MKRKSDKLRDMDTPMVLGIELDRKTLTPVRRGVRPVPPTPPVLIVPPVDAPPPTMKDPAPHTGLMRDLATLSSGTLASLSKISDMAALDRLQADLLKFYVTEYKRDWQTWIDVWRDFDVYRKQA